MAVYLLDSSIIIDALNRKRDRWQLLGSLVAAGDALACSAVSVAEIYAGMRPHESFKTQTFLEQIEHYAIDFELARYAGILKNEWARKGRTLSLDDIVIAATALMHKLVLVTDNRKDFPMPDLVLYPAI